MKKLLLLTILSAFAICAKAGDIMILDGQARVKNLSVERAGDNLVIDMNIDVTDLQLKSEREVTLTPVIRSDSESLALDPVVIAGRNRYIRDLRHDVDKQVRLFRAGKTASIPYHATVPFADWMMLADVTLAEDLCGCAGTRLLSADDLLTRLDYAPVIFAPEFVYITPVAEVVKTRELHGSAYIDFPVNRTEIYPDYRRNPQELARIRATIDTVRNDADTHITSIEVKGYASPEGPYAGNERLAQGRTETLAHYVQNLYTFPAGTMKTAWEAEDWAGLINYVRSSSIADKDAILAVITDDTLAPDAREWRLKSRYPEQYRFLLAEVYPGLRHSDYTVHYTVRSYTEVSEIIEVMRTAPNKLSIHELFMVARTLEPGSPEYNEVFELAVRMYPDSPVANLNAAVNALRRDDLTRAAAYLDRAGDSPEATYARGILAVKSGDHDKGAALLRQAAGKGIKEADDALSQLQEIERRNSRR